MNERLATRVAGAAVMAMLVGMLSASAATARGTTAPGSVDPSRALARDGSFVGAPGLSGNIDTARWRIASDITSNAAPRLVATGGVSLTSGPSWGHVGDDGSGGPALPSGGNQVNAMAVSGSNLYIAGSFINAGGVPEADFVARWDGSAWHSLGGSGGTGALNSGLFAMAVSGSDVYVGGSFTNASGIAEADFVAKWNGSFWSALGSNGNFDGALNNSVAALAIAGNDLWVGGYFSSAGGAANSGRLAYWNSSTGTWSGFGSSLNSPNDTVLSLIASGSTLYAGGYFQNLGDIATADFIAYWNGSSWAAVGGGLNGGVNALVLDSGDLYAGGSFTDAGGQATADWIARLHNGAWEPLGSNGAGDGALNSTVYSIVVSGGSVYAGGQFQNAQGIATADRVARFNGTSWSGVGSDGAGNGALDAVVRSIALTSTYLFAGGDFANASGDALADTIARWGPLGGGSFRPDGRIKKGTGTLFGNDIYNADGTNQTVQGTKTPGNVITFNITVQNDGTAADKVKVKATGTTITGYAIKYFAGTTDITSAVVAGTYQTPSVAVGATFAIKAKVTVKSTAAKGSSVTRLVTLTSIGDATKTDAVKLIGKRG